MINYQYNKKKLIKIKMNTSPWLQVLFFSPTNSTVNTSFVAPNNPSELKKSKNKSRVK